MTSQTYIKLFIFALIGTLSACTSPLHQGLDLGDPAPISKAPLPVKVTEGKGVNIKVIPMKQTVELGEPVYVAIRVTNLRQESIRMIGSLRPGDGFVEIYMEGLDKDKVLLPPISDTDFEGVTILKPNQSIGDVIPVFFGANGWNFTQPGDYRISASLTLQTEAGLSRFNSEAAGIKVESVASNAIFTEEGPASVQAGKFLLWRSGDHLQAGIKQLVEHAKNQPESALSSYVAAARAQNYSEPFANYAVKKVRPPNCRQANEIRNSIKKGVLPDNLLIEGYMSQAKCFALEKNWSKAKRALDAGEKLSRGAPEFSAYYQVIKQMQKYLAEFL